MDKHAARRKILTIEWKKKHPDKLREHSFNKNYRGIFSYEEYVALIKKQKGKCAICPRKPKKLHFDHCHKKKKARGLLCTQCNVGLGMFREDIKVMRKAIKYVKTP